MELDKKKYKKAEVEKMIGEIKEEYSAAILAEKERIAELTAENEKLTAELSFLKSKEDKISSVLSAAEDKAADIKRLGEKKFELEKESLKSFAESWGEYFSYLKEKYPYYSTVKKSAEIYNKLNKYLSSNAKGETIVKGLNKSLSQSIKSGDDKNQKFDPMGKINEYVAATSDNGFDLNAVLNPGEIKLEDICKELGLMTEE